MTDLFWAQVTSTAPRPTDHPLTVVITAFRRPQKLAACIESVVGVFDGPIVVSSTGTNQAMVNALHAVLQMHPSVTVVATAVDHNCNENWIRGVYQVRTPYVLVLHDDDTLEPAFKDVYTGVFRPMMDRGETDLFMWTGLVRPSGGARGRERVHTYDRVVNQTTTGFVGDSSADVLGRYRQEEYPITPVVQIYRRHVALAALVECGDQFTSFLHFSRPGMMLGNEIMMTTRSLQLNDGRARVYYYRDRPLTALGYWPESETVRFKGNTDLLRGYALAHRYGERPPPPTLRPRLIVAISAYPAAAHSSDFRRNRASFASWVGLQDLVPEMQVVYVHDRNLLRKDSRVPHLFDVLGVARAMALPSDVIGLCNSDILVTSDFWDKMLPVCLGHGAAFSYRKNYGETETPSPNLHSTQLRSMEQDRRGADLFCFTREFYDTVVKPTFPDMLLGRVSWDWAMRALLECTAANGTLDTPKPLLGHRVEVSGVTYHQKHESRWLKNPSTRTGNRMNLEGTRALLTKLGGGRVPEHVQKELTALLSLCG